MTWSEADRRLVGVIADDLTGANATGILLRRRGFRTASLTGLDWPEAAVAGYDCVCLNTESRALPPAEARERVARAAGLILAHGGRPLAKRIDSTLRGNLGPELEAVLAALGEGSLAVVTGAYPASGRTTVGGYHYVHGVLLAETPVSRDPLCPVRESHVPTLLRAQTRLPVGELPLATVRRGPEAVAAALREAAGRGLRLVCADSETDADIAALGEGMARSGLVCVAADPGPLTAAYLAAQRPLPRPRVLVVAGSVTPLTREQLQALAAETGAALVTVDAAAFAGGDAAAAAAEVERVVRALAAAPPETGVLGVVTGERLPDADRRAAVAIADGLAEVTARVLAGVPGIRGLYTTGGDTTLAVCRRLGAGAVELLDEVLPLAALGRLAGGPHAGLLLVSKGGLVGGPDAALLCVRRLFREVTANG